MDDVEEPLVLEAPEPESDDYEDFKNSEAFTQFKHDVDVLRQAYIGNDERKFTMLNSLYQILNSM